MNIKFTIPFLFLFSCRLPDKRISEAKSKEENLNCMLRTGWYLVDYSGKGCKRMFIDDTSSYYLKQVPLITSANIVAVEDMKFMDETPGLLIDFDSKGTKQWEKATGSNVGNIFAFVLNDTLLLAQANTAKISTGKAFFALPKHSRSELDRIKRSILAEIKLKSR